MSEMLIQKEEIVFNVIEEYLSRNRAFNIKEILPYINSRFSKLSININDEGIQKILKSLVEKRMVIEGKKLTKKNILLYSRRKKLYEYIHNNPGKKLNKIAKELEMSNSVIFWHLTLLLKFQLIKKLVIDNHPVYFTIDINFEDAKKISFISKEKCKKIINHLRMNNIGLSKYQLSSDLKIHNTTLKKYVKTLEAYNIITKKKMSNKTLYFLNE